MGTFLKIVLQINYLTTKTNNAQNLSMITFKKLKVKNLAVTFFLATFLFFTSTVNVLAASNQSQTTYPTDDSSVDGLLYSDSDNPESLNSVEELIGSESKKRLLDPTQIPAEKQPIIDRSNPDNKLLEKTGQMFEDAGNFSAN